MLGNITLTSTGTRDGEIREETDEREKKSHDLLQCLNIVRDRATLAQLQPRLSTAYIGKLGNWKIQIHTQDTITKQLILVSRNHTKRSFQSTLWPPCK